MNFLQGADESLSEAWERMQEYLKACPHHQIGDHLVTRTFFDNLNDMTKINLNAACGGQFTKIPLRLVGERIDEIVSNQSWGTRMRKGQSSGGNLEVDATTQLQAQLDQINKKLAKMTTTPAPNSTAQVSAFACEICGGTNHDTSYCGGINPEHVAAIGYGSNMRDNWRGPNMNYQRNNDYGGQNRFPNQGYVPPGDQGGSSLHNGSYVHPHARTGYTRPPPPHIPQQPPAAPRTPSDAIDGSNQSHGVSIFSV